MHLTWALARESGQVQDWIEDRQSASVTIGLNAGRTASLNASLEDNAVNRIHAANSRLKVWLTPAEGASRLIFNGSILQPRATGRRVEIPAVCPHHRLLKASPAPLPLASTVESDEDREEAWEPIRDMETSELMWELIHRSNLRAQEMRDLGWSVEDLGIIEGNLAATRISRSIRPSDVKPTWDQLVDYSKGRRTPDFELVPLDRTDHVHARFDTHYPKQGTDKRDEVVLEYGHNLSDFAWEPSGADLCNRYVLVGKGTGKYAPAYVAENRQSMQRFGVHELIESAPDTKKIEELERRAIEHVAKRAFLVNFVDVTLPVPKAGEGAIGYERDALGDLVEANGSFASPPEFGPDLDCWIGDVVTLIAKDQFRRLPNRNHKTAAPDLAVPCRITDATYNEIDRDGNVAVSLTTAPIVDRANVTGYESLVRLDPEFSA